MKLVLGTVLCVLVVAGGGSACGSSERLPSHFAACKELAPDPGWYGDNRGRLQQVINERGRCGQNTSTPRPIALFDWDNTVVRNDIGSATAYWMLRNNKIRQPAGGDWRTTSRYLTAAAADALARSCGTSLAAPGQSLATSTATGCADALMSVIETGQIGGTAAFNGYDHRRMEPTYAWVVQLMAGYTEEQIKTFARAARQETLTAPIGAKQTVGTTSVPAWIRYYEPIKNLIATLQDNGFDVRIVSASAQPVVQVWASEIGVEPSKVIGIRPSIVDGRITAHLRGCGDTPDGDDSMINYIDGKRCLVNQEVLGITGTQAWQIAPAERRQSLAAGDSVTDISFLADATDIRLVINRNAPELMCTAYANNDGKWIINPMFIQPKPQAAPYQCATAATTTTGAPAPVLHPDGTPIGPTTDTIY